MSLIKKPIELIVGESSDIYEFSSDDFPDLSSDDWVSEFTLRTKDVKGAIETSGSINKNQDKTAFVFQLIPSDTASLTPGLKFLSIDVKNTTINFRQEIVQIALNLKASGI